MPTSLPARTYRTNGSGSRMERSLLAAYAVSLAAVCSLIVINGPQMRAAAEAEELRVIEEENQAFCGRFGIGPETGRYAQCAAGLAEIRSRHLQRSAADSIL
jgi:hypothetical protein